eukprot:gene2703-3354_t
MEFPNLGKHCSSVDCNALDFLPFECEYCKKQYCFEHKSYESHSCPKYKDEKIDVYVHQCPVCGTMVKVLNSGSLDESIAKHMSSPECFFYGEGGNNNTANTTTNTTTNTNTYTGNYYSSNGVNASVFQQQIKSTGSSNVPKSFKCAQCKSLEFVPVICDNCKSNFCFKHRFPTSHNCSTLNANKSSNNNKQQSSNIKSNSPPNNNKPQSSNIKPNSPPLSSKSMTDNSPPLSTKIMTDKEYNNQIRKQQEELKQLRSSQREEYSSQNSDNISEINILMTNGKQLTKKFHKNETLRSIQSHINQYRTDGKFAYAIITDKNDTPFTHQDLNLTLKELDLYPSGNLIMIKLDEPQNQGSILSYLNPFSYFKS